MKKNLFLLFALICSTSLFTACSDDDEDTGWQEIPKEIPAENVKLDVNGATPAGATATLEVKTAETGVLTLDKVVYGHASIPVNVTLTKVAEGSYDFTGTANIDGATKMDVEESKGLNVSVKGNVTKAGKLTVNVTTSGWGTLSGVYSGDSLKMTTNGKAQIGFGVTLNATAETKATLLFSKITSVANDFPMDVTLTKDGDGYKIAGSGEMKPGYLISATGTLAKNVLTVDVTTSGYATISTSYSAKGNTITYNGVAIESGSIYINATSETVATINVSSMIPGSDIEIKDSKLVKATDSETYTVSGSAKTAGYEIAFEGTISPERKMTGAVTYKILSPIVGKWGVKMGAQGAESIFNFASKTGVVNFPKEIIDMLPADLKPYFAEQMPDAQLIGTVKGLLGKFVPYLHAIEFTEGGNIVVSYTEMGKTDVKELRILNYYIKDNQVYMVFDLMALLGMLPKNDTKAWDPGSFLTEGIPLDFTVQNGVLNVWVNHEVVSGLLPILNGFLPFLGEMLGDKAELITTIFGTVNNIVSESTQFEAGLVLQKK